MLPFEELSYRGQARRLRAIASTALERQAVPYDKLSLIFHGENTTFRASHRSGDHLVRVHRPGYQNRRTIASELELLEAIRRDTGLRVPEPVGGAQTIDAPGVSRRDVVIFRWIRGRFSSDFSPPAMRRLGGVLARLHRFAEGFVPSERFERQFWTIEGLTGENMGGSLDAWPSESRDFVAEMVERAADVVDQMGRDREVWGLIHADLHHGNRLVCEGGELAVIDFDDCGFGYYLYDLAVALGYPRVKFRERYPEVLAALLEGYRAIRPISEEHIDRLPAFFALRQVAIALWVLGRAKDNPYFARLQAVELERAVQLLRDLDALTW